MAAGPRWTRIGALSFRRRMALVSSMSGGVGLLLLLQIAPPVVRALDPDAPLLVRLAWILLASAVAAVLGLSIGAAAFPGVLVAADGRAVRLGRRTVDAAAIDGADLETERSFGTRQQLVLRLKAGRTSARLWLRARDEVLLTDDERALLLTVIDRSTIAPPVSPYDPSGRFSRVNFPGSLTKRETMDLVRNVPMPGERLPLTD